MNIVITGSLGNISKPLAEELISKKHSVTIISSKADRRQAIEALGAKAAIGTIQDPDFLTAAFKEADIVYLMEAWEGIGNIFDKNADFVAAFTRVGNNYKQAVKNSGVRQVVHLSSIGAHTNEGIGSLYLHNTVETILNQLPETVSIKFMRPVGFYTNLYRYVASIKTQSAIIQTYGGDQKEPWVSPLDIAAVIAQEMEKPFIGRSVHYVASDEVSPNEIASTLGEAIGLPELKWQVIPRELMLQQMLDAGMNDWIANGMVQMQAAQQSGSLYDDYYCNKPVLGKVKLADFAKEFALTYHK
ncbi:NAD(P)H-binding protein [Dyadobacter chenwenxiniae]|uniref:NAD(P)H-binding protein n=1 Tax=Dyadobacter chenwenxiniae TaxID=2906456 RepID=A0A9X1THK9_9BACT|nr:NAD(P)H-binding protein [Dyadobacter chenwenxiniae]MCF0064599.1 NAD(P)H-binding protein [Dyadobacter chenwenxiniae]UON84343.1 NAD(P)H-binding protein [Dyadobacter chenwenxiniae]